LWDLYKKLEGKAPDREVIAELAEELNLKENQIYKWFWDTKKKVEEDNVLARELGKISSTQMDQFGGHSKT
jgi:hypothetical protein